MNTLHQQRSPWNTGKTSGLKLCLDCHKMCPMNQPVCHRCGAKVAVRRRNSLAFSWALTITAALLYIPANLLPMMTVSKLEPGQPQTIMSGVLELIHQDMIPIAILVFTASIAVPLLKLLGMFWLLLCVHFPHRILRRQVAADKPIDLYKPIVPYKPLALYRLIIWVGRWSMLDIFIIALLVGLVQFGKLGTVTAGMGAYAFASVVVATMLAAIHFDPRLLWDAAEQADRPYDK